MTVLFPVPSLKYLRGNKDSKISWKDTPEPLPENRPRPLTPPLSEDVSISEEAASTRPGWQKLVARKPNPIVQRTYEQRQSPLARLPPEIRQLIWKHYLCGHQFHVVCANRHYKKTPRGRLVGIKCSENPGSFPCVDHDCWGRIPVSVSPCRQYSAKEPRWYLGQFSDSTAEEVNFVALLQTCRLIYSEAVDLLYARNVYCFDDIDTIIRLSRTVLPQRLDQMRWVRLTYHFPFKPISKPHHQRHPDYNAYVSACDVLAKLPKLEELIIHLHPGHDLEADSAVLLLDPLRRIRQLRTFSVHLYTYDPDQKVSNRGETQFHLVIHNSVDSLLEGCGRRRLRGQ